MQKRAKEFIDLLRSQDLLSPDILEELRRQVSDSKSRLTPELLAKLLVDNGHLTKFQATKLIAEVRDQAAANDQSTDSEDIDEELGFADEAAETDGPVAAVFVDGEDPEDVEVLEAEPVYESSPVAEAVPIEAASTTATAPDDFGTVPKPTKVVRPVQSAANPWDSFRILGVGLILALFVIAGSFLVYYFWRGNAEERLKRADDAYEQRSYETAANMYREFADVFPANDKASYAKVRAALAALRKDSEGAPDPQVGLRTALDVLPRVADEPALNDLRGEVAGALIALASKFNARADGASTTAERKSLMADMEKLLELINDPRFVGATQRNQQAPTLDRIAEDRQRILREINRDEELAKALEEIDQQLEAEDTLAAYDIRKALINRYPLLEADAGLNQRVARATEIQQTLVESGSLDIQLSSSAPQGLLGRSFVLAHRTGSEASALAGHSLFVRVKGSVYGLDGATGEVLWRSSVGRESDSDPLRLGEARSADALIANPARGQLTRVAGVTGATQWSADLGQPLYTPVAEEEELFLTTPAGNVACLDSVSGQTKWVAKLPQPIEVAPGIAFRKPQLYVAAEHSNLYVLGRSDGQCKEVVYLGHRPGSIAVPPVLLMGQLFVFENINNRASKIRIFQTSDSGLELREAQVPIMVEGNIVVPPQADGRRLVVQSDLGQILVLDIEPTADSQKVTTIASIPKNLFQPRLSWTVAADNKLWVADSRFTRFDLQVSLGKLVRAWIKNDGDQFAGPPMKFDNLIVHTRSLRGNLGVRVAAVDASTGEPRWETDLGAPIKLLHAGEDDQVDAINSSAMLFKINSQPLRSQADANPGQGKPAMLFANPVQLATGPIALLNQSRMNQLAVYTPTSHRLRLLAANFGSAAPSCEAVAVEDQLAVGLDNGQVVLIDSSNGSQLGAPYQPAMRAGQAVVWNRPVYFEDSKTLVIASDLQKLVRLSVGDGFRPLSEVDLEVPLVGPLVRVGDQVGGIESSSSGDVLRLFDPSDLAAGASLPLLGRRISGPYAVTDGCLIQTDSHLQFVAPDGRQLWALEFPDSMLAGSPIEAQGKLVLVTRAGEIFVIDQTSGELSGRQDVGQPLSAAPLARPAGLLLGTDEGTVMAVPMPSSLEEATQ